MRRILTAVLALGLAGCAPSINPQMKAATDNLAGSFQTQGRNQAAPAVYEPTPWAAGQWIVQRTVDDKGNIAIQRLSVVAADNGGIWLQMDRQDYFHHTIAKILYARMPRTADEAMDVLLKVETKTDDKAAQTVDFVDMPLAALMKGQFKAVVQAGVVPSDLSQTTKETVTVPAGAFHDCAKVPVQVSIMGSTQKSTSWFHPAVPINGSVKASSDDGKWTVELLDYGTSGAAGKM
ncbi:MAG: hypothetical protein WCG85_04915 [Polyangia bacterium]